MPQLQTVRGGAWILGAVCLGLVLADAVSAEPTAEPSSSSPPQERAGQTLSAVAPVAPEVQPETSETARR